MAAEFGGLAVLVAGLKLCKGTETHDAHAYDTATAIARAREAHAYDLATAIARVLEWLCFPAYLGSDLVDEHLRLLAHMQTATHLSGLLCPIIDETDEWSKLRGAYFPLVKVSLRVPHKPLRVVP